MFRPLGSLLSIFYGFTKSYGFSIILLTVTVRLILFPLTAKQMRSMNSMARVQPQIKKMQAEYKDDRQKLNEEMMKFYKQEGINPAAGCLPLILQIPVFIGLFRVIRGLSSSGPLSWLGIHVAQPSYLSKDSEMYRSIVKSGGRLLSWGYDLAESAASTKNVAYIGLVVVYAASGWVQQSLATKRQPAPVGQAAQMQQIMKVFPIFMGIFAYNMPAGLVLYWFASNLWTIGQQEILAKTIPRHIPEQEVIEVSSVKKSVRPEKKQSLRDQLKESAKAASEKAAATATVKATSKPDSKKLTEIPTSSRKTTGNQDAKASSTAPGRNLPPGANKNKRGR
jgi:YidC/Oxa1 family membrane protein insertase